MIKKSTFLAKTVFTFLLLLVVTKSNAQFSITSTGTANTWDFDGLQSSGTTHAWTNNTTIAGFYNARQTSPFVFASYTVGTGSSNSGQLYSFGSAAAPDRALGSVCSGTPGNIAHVLRLVNNTGSFISSIVVTYTGEQWRDGGAATPNAQPLSFYYKVSSTATTTFDVTTTGFTSYSALNFISPTFLNTSTGTFLDGNSVANRTSIVATITVSCAVGDEIYLKWIDINDLGSDHGLAIDDLSVTAIAGTPTPEINLLVGATNYANNSTYNFGTQLLGGTYSAIVTIQNTGTVTLNISSGNTTNNTEFNIIDGPPTPFSIGAGLTQTFTMVFTPTVAGTFTNILTIVNDDADESTYTVTYSGVGVAPAPEINLLIGATNYANNSTYNFGTQALGGTYTAIVTLQNTGTATLNISSGNTTNNTDFDIPDGPPTPFSVVAGSTQTFTMVFTPTVAGTFTNVLTIVTDDTDESTYTVTFNGVGVSALNPEINVLQSATSYTSGSTYSYNNTDQNWFTDAVFTIENIGNAPLSISTYSIVGTEYSLIGTMPTSVAASSVASFTLRFAPTALGTFTGSVTLTNNDANEGSYVVNLTGVSVLGAPAIFTENFGNPGGTSAIATYTGWSSTGLTFTGTGDIRNTSASTGYFGATGSGNAFLTNVAGRNIEISNVNTSTCSSFTLSFGVYKSATTADGSTLAVEVSSDGTNYTALTFDPLPTGAGTVGWYYRTASGTIPQAANLRIRFTNTSTLSQFRVDDVQLKGVCPPAPEINFIKGATSYLNGSTYNFGTINTGSTNILTFSIQNLGTATLNLTTATFTGGAEYTVISDAIPTTVAAGGVFTVTVVYSPTVAGTYTEVLTVSNNDADENPYVLNISSIVNAVAPEINIKQGATNYLTGSTYNFSNTTVLTSNTVVFTIENTGTADLNISNTSNNGSEFDVTSTYPIPLTIAAGNTATFSVTFQPTVAGTYSGSVSFTTDDANEATYIVSYTGVANPTIPEINLTQNGANFLTGATHSFGSVNQGTTNLVTFTVQNTGTGSLTISTYSFTGSSDFSVSSDYPLPHTVLAGQTSTFTITLGATAVGTITGAFSFTNDDASENPYLVNVSATVVSTSTPTAPEINLTQNGANFLTGATHSFGSVNQGTTNLVTFTVQNTGTASLTLSTYSFTGSSDFSFSSAVALPATILAGQTSTFTITLAATAVGTITGAFSFSNDDASENPYLVNVNATVVSTSTATAPEINVKQATTSIASSGTHDFGSVTTGAKNVVFTIENTGTAALTISSNTITGAQFSLVGAMPTSVAAGSTADFTVQFSSTTPGAYVGSITIVNDDANEASYVINFTASVPTSIEEAKADDAISIYPNPNKGTILNFTKTTDATIYNAIGAKVMEVKNSDKVDVSVLENGIYMLNINNKTKRLIIAK